MCSSFLYLLNILNAEYKIFIFLEKRNSRNQRSRQLLYMCGTCSSQTLACAVLIIFSTSGFDHVADKPKLSKVARRFADIAAREHTHVA